MEGLLFGVTAEDRATYLTGLLALVALVASAVPALRAARSDPIVALKGESAAGDDPIQCWMKRQAVMRRPRSGCKSGPKTLPENRGEPQFHELEPISRMAQAPLRVQRVA
jgi:hypothetical protein